MHSVLDSDTRFSKHGLGLILVNVHGVGTVGAPLNDAAGGFAVNGREAMKGNVLWGVHGRDCPCGRIRYKTEALD